MNMKMGALIFGISLLVGCGGGSSDSSTTENLTVSFDGLYVNSDDKIIMVVDATRSEGNIIVGDFIGDSVLVSKTAKVSNNGVEVKGYTYVDHMTWVSDDDSLARVDFNGSMATITTNVDNQNYIYTMKKEKESLQLSDIVGVRTNYDDGSVWTVSADGSFQINTTCQISGTLKRNGFYFDMFAVAENCEDYSMNGQYIGVMLTANYGDEQYLAGVLMNDTSAIWGSVSL